MLNKDDGAVVDLSAADAASSSALSLRAPRFASENILIKFTCMLIFINARNTFL